MRNFAIFNGCSSSSIVSPTHRQRQQQFLIHEKPSLSLCHFICLSVSKPISLPSSSSSSSSTFKFTNWGSFREKTRVKDVELFHTLAGPRLPIQDLIRLGDLIKPYVDKYSLGLAVRSERHSGSKSLGESGGKRVEGLDRRQILLSSVACCLLSIASFSAAPSAAAPNSEFADMPALRGKDYGKTKMRYPDYTETETGLQYKDLRIGTGPTPKIGETVVVDWDGYTIGYYGRIFEARNKTKGGSFEGDDKDFFKFKIGSQEVIPAFEEAVVGMSLGGVRRIIVPPELGYPGNDYNQKGPRPTTFSGQRALDFVLRNQGLIDKTLLFDIELLKIIPS